MNCADTRARLAAYADGALDPADAAAVEAELARCAACRAALDEMNAAFALLDHADPVALPAGFEDGFRARLAATTRSATRWRRRGLIVAGVALAVGLLVFALWPRPAADPPAAMIARLDLLQDFEVIDQLDALLVPQSVDDVEVIATLDALAEEIP